MKTRSASVVMIAAALTGCASGGGDEGFRTNKPLVPLTPEEIAERRDPCNSWGAIIAGFAGASCSSKSDPYWPTGSAGSGSGATVSDSGSAATSSSTSGYVRPFAGTTALVAFRDFDYLDATHTSAAFSVRKLASPNATASVNASLERSSAKERPYSYYGWDLGPGIDTFWPEWTFMVGARASVGSRKYADTDPLFGERRVDAKRRLEVSIGNKRWRWRNSDLSLVASLERNTSTSGFYSYRKTNVSVVIE